MAEMNIKKSFDFIYTIGYISFVNLADRKLPRIDKR